MSTEDNGRITFTVKELLGKLDEKLDRIAEQLSAKADAHDLERLEERVIVLEGSAATEAQLAAYRAKAEADRKRDRKWLIGFGTGTVLSLMALAATVLFNFIRLGGF